MGDEKEKECESWNHDAERVGCPQKMRGKERRGGKEETNVNNGGEERRRRKDWDEEASQHVANDVSS